MSVKSIAIVNTLGDFGITQYCHELANGLVANGVTVDVYAPPGNEASRVPPPRNYRFFGVLGSSLVKQRTALQGDAHPTEDRDHLLPPPHPNWIEVALRTPAPPDSASEAISNQARRSVRKQARATLRKWYLTLELVACLKWRSYDVVWTQWPDLEVYCDQFWRLCRLCGMRAVHTVHNVLPHETNASTYRLMSQVYSDATALFVHSQFAHEMIKRTFPKVADRTHTMWMGLYNIYPRVPEKREGVRRRLGVGPADVLLLFCGGVRPYKNIDAVLAAMKHDFRANVVLGVAGCEAGYSESSAWDPLARTRRLARELGVSQRVRLIPRTLTNPELAELFEAGDILILPYLEGYGSAMLLLGMTFGKHIISTRTGGAEEYLHGYDCRTLLDDPSEAAVKRGIDAATEAVLAERSSRPTGESTAEKLPHLRWEAIARRALEKVSEG
ncbi:MAG: glycosyltransferase family 4 protein [Acidobacteria bacterium]|nr:glycosyltransferase family 4 protein [Acidobacteriota bacterium]